jgi:hypothetical protein
MAIPSDEIARIDREFQIHLKAIRASGKFTLDPWEGFSCAIEPEPGEYPTVREMRALSDPEAAWKATSGSVHQPGDGKPKPCRVCGKGKRAKKRTWCYQCLHKKRVAAGWNVTRAEKRQAASASGE